jgi:asparagine synthase (glutamine-hydrolysing)
MCGFAGVVVWDDRYRVSPETLQKMSARIAHRGPDGEGYHINHQDPVTPDRPQVALAFRRLAILDPDPRSNQPFTDGRHWLVFNGEIYNFRELRKELSSLRPDYPWRTTGDTEVLLAAYAQWGEKCVEHLNGMFAFAVWDEREKTLFLARDRMGQKPLYLVRTEDRRALAFASELSAFTPMPWGNYGKEDPFSLERFLRYGNTGGCPPGKDVLMAPVGSYYDIHRHHHVLTRYDPDEEHTYWCLGGEEPIEDEAAITATRDAVRLAVTRQLVSDVPLGVFLSGGVDSSIIAACARRVGPVQTFSIGFDDPRYDETGHAREVARHLQTEHHELRVTPDVIKDLPRLAEVFGEPFADSSMLPTHYLARETRKHVKVALSGDGGDELFGGYDRYRAMRLAARAQRWQKTNRLFSRASARVADIWSGGHPKSKATRAARFFRSLSLDDAHRYDSYLRIFDERLLASLLRQTPTTSPYIADRYASNLRQTRDPVRAALALDREWYLPDDLLTKVDRCSMLHGLEVRSPFMDHELVQFAAGLTTDQLLRGGPKRMLREAFAGDLPAWVFKRKKMGFAVPIGEWFRGPLRSMLRDTLFAQHAFGRQHFNMNVVQRLVDEHEQERVDHSQRLYALLMLELWWNTVKT